MNECNSKKANHIARSHESKSHKPKLVKENDFNKINSSVLLRHICGLLKFGSSHQYLY